VGAFGAISSFAFRRRGRSCVRLAGMGVSKADEPDFWPDGDYSWGLSRFLTSTRMAGVGFRHGRPCSRTTRVTAFRMGGSEFARGRENSCCVRLRRVAGAYFATFIEQTFPSQVPGNHCFLMDSPSRSRIRRKMQHLGPSRDGLCLGCKRNALFPPSNPGLCHVGRRSLDSHSFSGPPREYEGK
jgi:hypothetical protein